MRLTRREAIGALAAGLALGGAAGAADARPAPLPPMFADIEARTFRYFWETTNPVNGLAPDRWPSAPFASIAATGFALTALPVGVARGWITRQQASARARATLEFFWSAPQGDARRGTAGHRGFFYHFLDLATGTRVRRSELSSVDTALLVAGILFVGEWFDGDHPDERRIRDLAQRIHARIDWRWMQPRPPLIAMGWHPESGFIAHDWQGYCEAMIVYLLALAAPPEHRVAPDAWAAWCATYPGNWRGTGGARHLAFAPQFGHQYSHVWVDFRGIRDAAMRAAGLDYFENSRRATYAQRAYAAANPMGWRGYSAEIWGLSACDGPGGASRSVDGIRRRFRSYSARGQPDFPDGFDDGTITPTAMLGSLPFSPEIVVPATQALHRVYGARLYGRYGFADAFNPSFRSTGTPLAHGQVDPVHGWQADDLLGIDQGPILAMIANARDGMIWRTMRRSAIVRLGLARAGFQGGWLERDPPAPTGANRSA